MDAGSSGSTDLLRVPVSLLEYPGMRSEIVIGDAMLLLVVLNPRPDIPLPLLEIRLAPRNFVGRQGAKIQFCSGYFGLTGSAIDFAGMGRDAWFHITCDDDASAARITEHIQHLRDSWLKSLPEPMRMMFLPDVP